MTLTSGSMVSMTADDVDASGTSAQRECERRKSNDEAKLRAKWGKPGGLAVAFSGLLHD